MRPFLLWMIGAALVLPAALFAHGVEVFDASADAASHAASARFLYTTGEPMMYAKIRLYPPSTPETEILQSITDRNGVFSFVPDETGEWRIDAEDGMGHKGSITIPISSLENSGSESSNSAGRRTPLGLRVLLGLSLILNIFALYSFVLRRTGKQAKEEAHAH